MKLEILFKFPMVGAKIRNYVIRKRRGENFKDFETLYARKI